MIRRALSATARKARALSLGAALLASASTPLTATAAQDEVAQEVKRVRAEIEGMLNDAANDLRRGPEAEKEAAVEREKAAALEKDVAAARAEAESAEAALRALEVTTRAAEGEASAERQKAEALAGYKKLAFEVLAKAPADRVRAVAELALGERPLLDAALARILAEPGAQAAAAFDELQKGAAAALPQADFEKVGSDTRARPRLAARPDTAAQLDALSLAVQEAAACEGVAPGDLPGRPPRIVAGPVGRRAAANRAGAELASRLRQRRESLVREARAALPRLQAALGSASLARAAARLAVLRGLREVVRDAARAALGVHVVPIVGEISEAELPRKAVAPLLGRIGKRRGGPCRPSEVR